MTSVALLTDDIEWMRQLQAAIWTKPEKPRFSRGRAPAPQPELIREITKAEWDRVHSAIEILKLPITMFNVNFGFGIALAIYEHAPIPEVKPEFLLAVSYEQLPDMPSDIRERWDAAWMQFETMARRPANLQVLAFYGMKPPGDRQHYEY